ncbi:hypothetical protein D3C85_1714480 [compost metagenome]
MQQRFIEQGSGWRRSQAFVTGEPRTHDRTDPFTGQFEDLHVRGPGRFGKHQQSIQAWATRIEIALAGR